MNVIFKPKQAESRALCIAIRNFANPIQELLDESPLFEQIQDFLYALIKRLRVWH